MVKKLKWTVHFYISIEQMDALLTTWCRSSDVSEYFILPILSAFSTIVYEWIISLPIELVLVEVQREQ